MPHLSKLCLVQYQIAGKLPEQTTTEQIETNNNNLHTVRAQPATKQFDKQPRKFGILTRIRQQWQFEFCNRCQFVRYCYYYYYVITNITITININISEHDYNNVHFTIVTKTKCQKYQKKVTVNNNYTFTFCCRLFCNIFFR